MASREALIHAEIQDPLYDGMTDAEILAELNVEDKSTLREVITGREAWEVTDPTQWAALTTEKRTLWIAFVAAGEIDPRLKLNKDLVEECFGKPSQTWENLVAASSKACSTAEIIGAPNVSMGELRRAQAWTE